MSSSTLVKTLLHNSVADSVFKEITTKTGRYYYFLGSVLDWVDPLNPPTPVDSFDYERDTRRDIVLVKEIQPSDVAYVIDRKNWLSNTVYDLYDDLYSDQVIGVDLLSGGSGYSGNTTVTISGGGGTGATANARIANGAITSIVLETRGSGYNTKPTVTITDSFGTGSNANAVLNFAYSGTNKLQNSNFYVITDEFNIYKCLDNKNNSASTVKPTEVSPEAFVTSDGYKWKFMGTVPVSLRNKFLSITQVPVTTSINSQFYSSGEIKTIDVIDTGNNYTYASIVVQGDGHLVDDPILIVQANVISGGNGYSSATVTIEPPLSNTDIWSASTVFNVGEIVKHENNFYEVIQEGTSATNSPVHTKGIAKNGNVILKFRGTGITANANIVAGPNSVTLTDLYGVVRDIVITNNGSGYTTAPNVTISGDGTNATATTTITNNTVNKITITNSGKNFTTPPSVIIGTPWVANANVNLSTQVFNGTRLYTVTTGGYGNTTAPTHTSGAQTLGNAVFTFAGTKATGTARLKYGAGYSRVPNVTITGNGAFANIRLEGEKTEAILVPYIDNGRITNVIIEDGGTGYTTATLTVVGDGANAEFQVNFSEGDLDTLQSTSELLAVPGAIHTIQVVSGGYGYSGANVTITGNGTGATANTTIVNGKVTKINVLSEGSGYTHANVIITGTGNGATARAIFPPYGGHGKDTVSELFARSLAFYTTIGQEKNQGFVVTNDYRQFGIIKEIRNYDNNKFFRSSTGSGCWLISGNINTSLFTEDATITRSSDSAKFIIISSESNGILAIPTMGSIPAVGDIFSIPAGNAFIATGITKPDVDKYSGELLYIDNRRAFTTTEDQSVSIKTVFKY